MSDVRERFETWAAFDCLIHEFDRNEDGTYVNEHVQSMWIGYEEADRERQRIAAANERMRQLAHEAISVLHEKADKEEDDDLIETACQLRDLLNETDADQSLFEHDGKHVVPNWLAREIFAIQHNPNCPSRYLVRLPEFKSGFIDMKSYYRDPPEGTSDALGFANSISEAAEKARASQETVQEKLKREREQRQKA